MAKAKKKAAGVKTVTGRILHDPVRDKLRPIFPLDLSKCRTIDQLVRAMGDTAYTARQVGDAADVLEAMAREYWQWLQAQPNLDTYFEGADHLMERTGTVRVAR